MIDKETAQAVLWFVGGIATGYGIRNFYYFVYYRINGNKCNNKK